MATARAGLPVRCTATVGNAIISLAVAAFSVRPVRFSDWRRLVCERVPASLAHYQEASRRFSYFFLSFFLSFFFSVIFSLLRIHVVVLFCSALSVSSSSSFIYFVCFFSFLFAAAASLISCWRKETIMTDLCVVERHYSVAKRGEKEKEQHGVDTAIDTHTHTHSDGWLAHGRWPEDNYNPWRPQGISQCLGCGFAWPVRGRAAASCR